MNQLQHEQYTGKGDIYQQLTLPISENILIDEHEPVYVANAQLEELDYRKLYQAYAIQRCCYYVMKNFHLLRRKIISFLTW